MFGTDNEVTEAIVPQSFRWLETADEYFELLGAPGQGRLRSSGLALGPTTCWRSSIIRTPSTCSSFHPSSGSASNKGAP